jgi:hypothetical protein
MTRAKSAPSRKSKSKKDKKDTDLGDEKATVGPINPPPIDDGGRPPGNHGDKPKHQSV